jgi:hypothetical protein
MAVHSGIRRLTDLKIGHYRRGGVANLVGLLFAQPKDAHEQPLLAHGIENLKIGTEGGVADHMIFFNVSD